MLASSGARSVTASVFVAVRAAGLAPGKSVRRQVVGDARDYLPLMIRRQAAEMI
jgi:hypothetical protein